MPNTQKRPLLTFVYILSCATLILCFSGCGSGTRQIAREMALTGQDTFHITIPMDMPEGDVITAIQKALEKQRCKIVTNKNGTITGYQNTLNGRSEVTFQIVKNKIVMKCNSTGETESYVPLQMIRSIEKDIQTLLYAS